jgi:uncharacterized membrane protein YciS (DUF1049 family)
MDALALPEWMAILKTLGLTSSGLIMGAMWWTERRDRRAAEKRQQLERDRYEEELMSLTREVVQSNQTTSSALSTLVSVLGSGPRKGRG